MLARFWDEESEGFFDTASDHADQALIIWPKNITDNAIPSRGHRNLHFYN